MVAAIPAGEEPLQVHPSPLRAGRRRGPARYQFLSWLRSEHPGLVDDYVRLYSTGSETPSRYREWLGGRIRSLFAKHGLPDPDASTEDKFALNGRRYAADDPAQLTLL